MEDLFKGSSEYYDKYRPAYPDDLIVALRDTVDASSPGALVDIGCGTGQLCIPLRPYFARVVAVDPDPEMIKVGRESANSRGIGDIDWHVQSAEEFAWPDDCSMVTAGSSFHWMDRAKICNTLARVLGPQASLALVGGGPAVWTGTSAWHNVATAVLRKHLGPARRAGAGVFSVPRTHESFLREAGFSFESIDFRIMHRWTIDTAIGYLLSTSYAGPGVLGHARNDVIRELRERLEDTFGREQFEEDILYSLILAGTSIN